MAVRITLFMAIVFAFNKMVERYIPQKYEVAFHVPFLLLAIFLAIPSLLQLGTFVIFVFAISWFLILFRFSVDFFFTKEVPIESLRPSIIPAERIVKIEQDGMTDKYMKVPVDFANPAQDNIIVDVSSEGLTPEQIEQLQQLAANGSLNEFENRLRIQEKIPFAFMIVLGALLTLLARGMVYSLIRRAELGQILEMVR